MRISITEAEARWDDVVARAEAGEEVVLTRDGEPVAKIVAVTPKPAVERVTNDAATGGTLD